jgi:[NiFe] hydrogenase diaphorase moiety small subunit
MSETTVKIVIDGVEIEAKKGQSIIQAADAAGIYIPRLCYHPDLPPGGHCRVCTVKINGRPGNACSYPASNGMVIENDTEEMNTFRRNIIEMMFVEGNHYCPSCEASGDCELQAMGYRLGLLAPKMPYLRRFREIDASHKDVYIDRDRCILCGRCVRSSVFSDKKGVFGFENRGINKRITVDAEHGLCETTMAATDKAAEICPTGCLTVKREAYRTPIGQRKYDKQPIGSDIEKEKSAT